MRAWGWALVLGLPMALTYGVHFATAPAGSTPTGFLQFDQFYYSANAREHFDSGRFTFFYSLPFSDSYESPRIYVQPMSLVLGWLRHLTGWDPGILYAAFGMVATVLFARVAMTLLETVVGRTWRSMRLLLVCFFWGGGLFALAGSLRIMALGIDLRSTPDPTEVLFVFDPFAGYWFLNLGRNVFYSTEAFYHVLSLGCVALALRHRWVLALTALAVLCASQPFTGIQFATIMTSWLALEWWLESRRGATVQGRNLSKLALSFAALAVAHVSYYLGYLGSFPEQRQLQENWVTGTSTWTLPASAMALGYLPVALLALWSLRGQAKLHNALSDRRVRLLLVWSIVSLALVKHELLFTAHQPLHFTRGYVWTPLFLLGAPVLATVFDRLSSRPRWQQVVLGLLVCGFLADNVVWFASLCVPAVTGRKPLGFYLSAAQRDVFAYLERPEFAGTLVVSTDRMISYGTTVYTPLRAWTSHPFNTPNYVEKEMVLIDFYKRGQMFDGWRGRRVLSIIDAGLASALGPRAEQVGFHKAYENRAYVVYVHEPEATEPSPPGEK